MKFRSKAGFFVVMLLIGACSGSRVNNESRVSLPDTVPGDPLSAAVAQTLCSHKSPIRLLLLEPGGRSYCLRETQKAMASCMSERKRGESRAFARCSYLAFQDAQKPESFLFPLPEKEYLGRALLEAGIRSKPDSRQAREFFESALEELPLDSRTLEEYARVLVEQEGLQNALNHFELLAKNQPRSAPVLANLAIIHLRAGNAEAAKHYLKMSVSADPRFADSFRMLGRLAKEEGDRAKSSAAKYHSYHYALLSLQKFRDLSPGDPEPRELIGELHFAVRDLEEAAAAFKEALRLDPNSPGAHLRLGQILRNAGKTEEARMHYRQEIARNPELAQPHVEMGNTFMAERKFGEAEKSFLAAEKIEPANADALFGLGVINFLAENHGKAIDYYNRSLASNPANLNVYWQKGLAYQRMKMKAEAAWQFTVYAFLTKSPLEKRRAEEKIRTLASPQ